MKKLFLWAFAVTLLCTWAVAGAVNTPTVSSSSQTIQKVSKEEALAKQEALVTGNVDQTPIQAIEKAAPGELNQLNSISSQRPAEYLEQLQRMKDEALKNRIPTKPAEGIRLDGGEDCASAVVIGALPYTDVGNTCDNVDDYEEVCPYESTSPDVVYSYTPDVDIEVDIDLCTGVTDYDTKLFVYENDCTSAYYACNDDACSDPFLFVSQILCLPMTAGNTYYIVVDGYGGGCGNFTLEVDECVPCVVECPDGAIDEGEPCDQDTNGGCNTDPANPPTTPIACGDTYCGLGWFDGSTRDTDWYYFTVDGPTIVTMDLMAEFDALMGIIVPYSDDICDNSGSVTYYALPLACEPGQVVAQLDGSVPYVVFVAPQFTNVFECGTYWTSITCEPLDDPYACCYGDPEAPTCEDLLSDECDALGGVWYPGENCATFDCPTCVIDYSMTAPIVDDAGTTCGAGDDCALRDTEDIMYEVEIPNDGLWVFSLCGSDYDTYMFVGTSCCGQEVGYNDDDCGLQSQVEAYVTAGTYYVDIEGYSSCGNYLLNVYESEPCVVECPPDSYIEQEPCGDDTNGGCNTDPNNPPTEPVECGMTVCGTDWADGGTRDTDWYLIDITEPTLVTLSGDAENPTYLAGIIPYAADDPCNNSGYLDYYTQIGPCAPSEVSFEVDGTKSPYVIWVGPNDFYDMPCDGETDDYYFTVTCEPLAPCENVATVEILTDDYPSETTWDMVHVASGTTVGSGGPYSGQQTLYQEEVCLDDDPTGCYLFTIYDSYGDGISLPEGYYNVYDPGGALVCTGGGNFGTEESCYFGDCTGACCVGEDCIGDMSPDECAAEGGIIYVGESCDTFVCPPPPLDCDDALYQNGDGDGGNTGAAQCDIPNVFVVEIADDFMLQADATIGAISFITNGWNGFISPELYTGITFAIYEDAGGIPDGNPNADCSHTGELWSQYYTPDQWVLSDDGLGNWQIDVEISGGLALTGGTTYWLGAMPENDLNTNGQSGWAFTSAQTGYPCLLYSDYFGYYWEDVFGGYDGAFCLHEYAGSECDYVAGDCNCNGTPLELSDVVSMIGQYRGSVGVCYTCSCPPNGDNFAPAADPNGNCVALELSDVVREIAAYRGSATAAGCGDCPPPGRILPGGVSPTLKSKVKIIEKSNTQ
jgi:hypothetical protein